MTDKPIVWATAVTGGFDIHCCKCGARMTAWAYIIETCQECGADKQDKRRRADLFKCMEERGRQMRKEHYDAVFAKMFPVRVVEQMPDGTFALVPDPLPIDIDVDELGRRCAISKTKEPEDDGTKS